MQLLLELTDEQLGLPDKGVTKYFLRRAARAIILNQGKIPLLWVAKEQYHKLPGGGIKPGEDIKQALARELKEETGCSATNFKDVGIILETRDEHGLIQLSYCYLAEVTDQCDPSFTQKELDAGFELKWVSLDEAIDLLEKDKAPTYMGKFITKRDLTFLQAAKIQIE